MSSYSYEKWLENQKDLCRKGLIIVQNSGLKGVIIENEGRPNFIRLYFKDKHVDFFVKSVKSRWVKSIWICKVKDMKPRHNWLIYCEKEKQWSIVLGDVILNQGERRESDLRKTKEEYYVIPSEVLRGAKTYFKYMKKRFEEQLQRRLTEW